MSHFKFVWWINYLNNDNIPAEECTYVYCILYFFKWENGMTISGFMYICISVVLSFICSVPIYVPRHNGESIVEKSA